MIDVINTQTMSSNELYNIVCIARVELGETQPRINDFHARVVDELDGEHYESFVVQNPNKTESTFFNLTIDQCMLVGMRESKSVRRSVLSKLKNLTAPTLPTSFSEALQLAADQAKQLEEQAPKIQYHDKVLATGNGITTSEVASELGMSAIKLNKSLQSKGVQRKIGKRWILCASQMGFGYTVECTHVDDGGKSRHAMKWTERGRKFIHDLVKPEAPKLELVK